MPSRSVTELFLAGNTCLRLVTYEEPEVLDIVLSAAQSMGCEAWVWSCTDGLRRGGFHADKAVPDTTNAAAAMVWLRRNIRTPTVCIFLDLGETFADPVILRAFRELVEFCRAGGGDGTLRDRLFVALIDQKSDVPPVVEFLSRRHDVPPPDDEEIEELVRLGLKRVHARSPVEVNIRRSDYQKVVENLRGLPRRYVVQAAMRLATDGLFDESDVARVIQEKHALIKTGGVLEAVSSPATLDDVGGMETLKRWLRERGAAFTPEGRERGLVPPRGVLLLGVQGGGKSLAAKAVASAWKRPLLRLDPGALYDRFVGESERRLRESLRQAEAMAPVVLWIDEIEKGFASAASQSVDGGLSKRMFGALLLWMQEREAPVFLVATANDIEALPPELLRKGRFDEIFFVDLPGEAARGEIFRIHLRKHKAPLGDADLPALIAESAGRSGAEIEQAIVSAQYSAYAASRAVTGADVITALRTSPPLSVTMREKLNALRAWARGRCVPAD